MPNTLSLKLKLVQTLLLIPTIRKPKQALIMLQPLILALNQDQRVNLTNTSQELANRTLLVPRLVKKTFSISIRKLRPLTLCCLDSTMILLRSLALPQLLLVQMLKKLFSE